MHEFFATTLLSKSKVLFLSYDKRSIITFVTAIRAVESEKTNLGVFVSASEASNWRVQKCEVGVGEKG
jgi:hypothetical protein